MLPPGTGGVWGVPGALAAPVGTPGVPGSPPGRCTHGAADLDRDQPSPGFPRTG